MQKHLFISRNVHVREGINKKTVSNVTHEIVKNKSIGRKNPPAQNQMSTRGVLLCTMYKIQMSSVLTVYYFAVIIVTNSETKEKHYEVL